MSILCHECKEERDGKYAIKFRSGKIITVCYACDHPVHSSTVSMFSEVVLSHAHDEDGNPIRVTSLRQLREAEKRYHFRSLVANEDERNFDKPPQFQQKTIADHMDAGGKWLYPDVAKQMMKDIKRLGITQEQLVSGERDKEWNCHV